MEQPDLHIRMTRLINLAVQESGYSIARVARDAGLKWDTVRRTVDGKRAATIPEIVSILNATGFPADETLRLMFVVDCDFAIYRSGSDAAGFLIEFSRKLPGEIVAQLGENVDELRPRWAQGTAQLLARTLSQHICELTRRGNTIGDLRSH